METPSMSAPVLPMPRRPWPIWLAAALVVVGLPATSFIYFPALLHAGELSQAEDSISIPLFSSALTALMLLPVVMLVTFLCARRYPAGGSLLVWRVDKPLLSTALSLAFGGPAVLVLAAIAATLVRSPSWYEYLWVPYLTLCAGWLLLLRAAALLPRGNGLP
jgi:hypothetical protein